MILTISTTREPATDLGFLLHKNPQRHQSVELNFGTAHVFYPEASETRCTVAVLVEVDPVDLVRNRKGPTGGESSLGQYVNDRPYAASSHLSAAINKLFSTAMSGRCKERPELVDVAMPFEVWLPTLPVRGSADLLERLFEPLGYVVTSTPIPLDTTSPNWGPSRYCDVRLSATTPLRELLEQLIVLIPVLDDTKHYWVGPDEIDRLLRRGGEWLVEHPERELITKRYLRHDRALTNQALERLLGVEDIDDVESANDNVEEAVERTISLNDQRIVAVVEAIRDSGARRVLDLGCGSAKLMRALLADTHADKVVGVDVSYRSLEAGARRLHLDTMSPRQRDRVELLHGSLTYRDRRLEGFDAAAVVEVIEHLDPSRLESFERVVFEHAAPTVVVITTPNIEYNVRFDGLAPGTIRHPDHRFEWTRAEFAQWATGVAERRGYGVTFTDIGPDDPEVGSPTQMAVFTK
ncbi:MAG: 3' terminal RNA ribose 2'-O-methyltransferase Hen1 [Acidimicrobiaceae bacterium]|nr:3' terminal RNA ribose 2'-O-methyltransferase Hen1 [Acidimicrobiaceae bacterium]